ncbi:hypothetical protein PMI18_01629 [Pseudomonas sp. GM102]|uniref:hypothetical protein n=1 Tax=Pseudomonas sp. GM102 TaxID=1144321 RepID=UPI00026FBD1B|nr:MULTISPECIES: hypothetical protein [Pseudomonas]EJM03519.1 hypothetical protein PMI18_01629 [Pseudomonas sp. GM102]TPG91163.1 hypothetical protein EAH72_27310 [Pseudomonas caspiana]
MDLVDTLRNKISALGDEECVPGLKAVLLHIETAFGHLSRGQEDGEDTAFTDSIYRTNQAFEGSIKEAYRVLANKDPGRKKPYEIENYLEKNGVFKPRVLSQLTTYRTEWRNPSSHDYKLNFDESEAFLAIVSVSAFSCLLLDQITERVAYNAAQAEAKREIQAAIESINAAKEAGLLEWVAELFLRFLSHSEVDMKSGPARRQAQFIGGLSGYMATVAPELVVQTNVPLGRMSADFIVAHGDEQVMVETKGRYSSETFRWSLTQLHELLRAHRGALTKGLIILGLSGDMRQLRLPSALPGVEVIVLIPADARVPEDLMTRFSQGSLL